MQTKKFIFLISLLYFFTSDNSQNHFLTDSLFGNLLWNSGKNKLINNNLKTTSTTALIDSNHIFTDQILGIKFETDIPKNDYQKFLDNIDTSNWLKYTNASKKISIKFPPCLKLEMFDSLENLIICDSAIVFEYFDKNDSAYYPIISFYSTKSSFEKIAFNFGFDTTTAIYSEYSNPPPKSEQKPVWVTHGRQGLTLEAVKIDGYPWHGLYGENFFGASLNNGGSGLAIRAQMLLFYEESNGCNIVFEYYDEGGYTNCELSKFEVIKMVEIFYKSSILRKQ